MNSGLSVHFSIFMSILHSFLRLGSRVFPAFFHKVTIRNVLSLSFSGFGLKQKLHLLLCSCTKHFGYWDMGQNALSQLGCRVFISDIKHEKIDELTWFLVFRYIFKQHRRWFINFNVKNVFSQSGLLTQLYISLELIGQRAWFFTCQDRLKKDKK